MQNHSIITTLDFNKATKWIGDGQRHIIDNRPIALNSKKYLFFKEHNFTCQKCGRKATLCAVVYSSNKLHVRFYYKFFKHKYMLTIDHIIPTAKGGRDDWENKQVLCAECNEEKGHK